MRSLEPKSAPQPVQNTSTKMQMFRLTKLHCWGCDSSTAEADQVLDSPFPLYHYLQMYLAAKVYQSSFTSFGLKHILTVLCVYCIKWQKSVQISPAAYPSPQLQGLRKKVNSLTVPKREVRSWAETTHEARGQTWSNMGNAYKVNRWAVYAKGRCM